MPPLFEIIECDGVPTACVPQWASKDGDNKTSCSECICLHDTLMRDALEQDDKDEQIRAMVLLKAQFLQVPACLRKDDYQGADYLDANGYVIPEKDARDNLYKEALARAHGYRHTGRPGFCQTCLWAVQGRVQPLPQLSERDCSRHSPLRRSRTTSATGLLIRMETS